ncbi:MAG: BlaI/MecI/CopY family transcriptional regulator [Verrucomicrobiota bacterium]
MSQGSRHLKLSRREREILEILFSAGEATTASIRYRLTDPPTGNAVRALLQIMEDKNVVIRKRKEGREWIFAPTENSNTAGRRALQNVIETFYKGSVASALAAHFAKNTRLSREDYDKLVELIEQSAPDEDEPQ